MRLCCALLCVALTLPGWSVPLGILTVDSDRRWDPENQAHWKPPASVTNATSDYKEILKPEVVQKLSFEQRKALLRVPARLLASDRAPEIFATPRLLLLQPAVDDRVPAEYIDLEHNQYRRLLSSDDQSAEQGRLELIAQATENYGPGSIPVFANRESQLYHKHGTDHVSPQAPRVEYPSFFKAEAEGYQPCEVCFPERNRALSEDTLERELGRTLAQRVEMAYRISQNQGYIDRVNRVGQQLLARNHLLEQGYRFIVLDADDVNAFAVPTGPLYITAGLLRVVESDAELAGILGHELAHAEFHHGLKQYERQQQLSWLALLTTVATGQWWVYSATNFFGTLLSRGYSRDFELEADRQGMWYAYGAGYQAENFRLTLQKFLELEKLRDEDFLSWLRTHPSSEERIGELNRILDRMEPMTLLLEEVEPVDRGLASYLREHGSEFLEDPVEVVNFIQAYRALNLPPRQLPPPATPSPTGLPDLK